MHIGDFVGRKLRCFPSSVIFQNKWRSGDDKTIFSIILPRYYGTSPDYPFDEDFETAVLRHADNRKWYALVMKVSRRKFGFESDEVIDVVNLKIPTEMFGSFGAADGVYPAYHMNKLHWISVVLPDAPDDVVQFLVNVSFEATKSKTKLNKHKADS